LFQKGFYNFELSMRSWLTEKLAFAWCLEISFLAANAGISTDMMATYGMMSVKQEDDLRNYPFLSFM
jgi:hypothetical protein